MVLQALYELADREQLIDDPDYQIKPVAYLIRVDDGGRLIGIETTKTAPVMEESSRKKVKPVARRMLVPFAPVRTSGDLAFFLVDKAEYALGLDPTAEPSVVRCTQKLAARHDLFIDQVAAAATKTDDRAARAVWEFLRRVAEGTQQIDPPEGCQSNDLFAFVHRDDERPVHLRAAVRDYWKSLRTKANATGGVARTCLVTGRSFAGDALFPPVKRLPGASTSGVPLVSFNAPAFESYGLSGNQNAPVCRQAAEAISTALNRLLDPAFQRSEHEGPLPPRRFALSDDTVVVFWSASPAGDDLCAVLDLFAASGDPQQVGDLYRSLFKGRLADLDDPAAFYAMTLTGSQGRVIVRDWLESSVREARDHLRAHFQALECCQNTRPAAGKSLPPVLAHRTLMESLAAASRSEKPVPIDVAAEFIRAALRGGRYPLALLVKAVQRSRAEIGRETWNDSLRCDARAALIKAWFVRDAEYGLHRPKVTNDMNPNLENAGYSLGMLLAVLERLQAQALGSVNASITDRYFSAASATPRSVFVRLLKNAQHHSRKARDNDDRKVKGQAFRCERLIDELADRFDVDRKRYPPRTDGIPAHLPLEDQALFVLGYHQMRHWLWLNNEERAAWEAEHSNAARAFRWLKAAGDEAEPAVAG